MKKNKKKSKKNYAKKSRKDSVAAGSQKGEGGSISYKAAFLA